MLLTQSIINGVVLEQIQLYRQNNLIDEFEFQGSVCCYKSS